MITAPAYQGKTIGVFGLARTGVTAVQSLTASGAKVFAWDDDALKRVPVKAALGDLYAADFKTLDALLLAPGVPLTHPEPHALVKKAEANHIALISDLDVFEAARPTLPEHTAVAITGTNGKSSTTVLIGHMIEACGRSAAIGGNIGTGVLSLSALAAGGIYVFELSSFQLDLTQGFAADIAILLNISPDHIDRHGTFENYIAAKKRLFDMQTGKEPVAIIGVDDTHGQEIAASLGQKVIAISVEQKLNAGVYVADGTLFDCMGDSCIEVGSLLGAENLQGMHNWQNAAAAYAVGRYLGFTQQAIMQSFASFPGLVHRQETVASHRGVRFVNDSKATNSDAAITALKSFDNILWVAGGRAKDTSFRHLKGLMSRVKNAYFIGEAADLLEADLGDAVASEKHPSLAEALDAAVAVAKPGDTILLSPACTAFDQFADFEKRGEAFTGLVNTLIHSTEGSST
ncbi:MAG: UDP-N-acetylmuramoyl-L-alanine--D-glutamate ligase [Kordiimonadaceae bacterium]|nr:UDP-N-acetylmuramoyl-L-alanine--D-glutamate ligase [Kordiimonadaceae bacterium]